ncbi:indole-3-glycerol phosphate synthase TrpC [Aureibacillus halotolerans]|uniref:Indole-3-glycerol phosphate synthase n=1 Tax=Aureibacillus halotolerans TaxID=1508390 RepID=A0A4R6UA17_9BACI|nr:indole-3-glycerol phosphate synthase TrpC [Aureibacillus halotolerans]TDQ41525.1 indole-3-glycerol phosphate synthase [Aureibacillus halotolerans]
MLNTILETKAAEIAAIDPTQFTPRQSPYRSLYEAVKQSKRQPALIAEVKKASPSKGLIAPHFQPVQTAKAYEKAGAAAISVLTDATYFQGSVADLQGVRAAVSIPVLRKDFIISEEQVLESAAIGADAILLIGEALEPKKLHALYLQATELGLSCLVEVHSKSVLANLLEVFTPSLIGINNRDLHTFHTALEHTQEIASLLPAGIPFVSESGIHGQQDVATIEQFGASAMLVGEHLMRSGDPEKAIAKLYGDQQ